MIAFKFLCHGAIGRFSEAQWPAEGQWLEAEGALVPCANGVHACTPETLAYWFDDELWSVELDGEIQDLGTVLLARRGRLRSPVDAWPGVALQFAEDCLAQVRSLAASVPGAARVDGLAAEAFEHAERAAVARHAVIAAYATAVAADIVQDGGFDAERRRQSRRLAQLLGLGESTLDRPS
jgi:hypothetical protein